MRHFRITVAALVLLTACQPSPPSPGSTATGPDASETARPRPPLPPDALEGPVVHVDQAASNADDANAGTPAEPLATIQAALDRAMARSDLGEDTSVFVAAGIYREELDLEPPAEGVPLESTGAIAVVGTDVVVSGADPVDARLTGEGLFEVDWTDNWGLAEMPEFWADSYAGDHLRSQPAIRRREIVVVDGVRLLPRTSTSAVATEPGTFVVLEEEDRILLHPVGDVAFPAVEVAQRDDLLVVAGRRDVQILGMTFRHAASHLENRAVTVVESEDVLLEDITAVDNSWFGVGVSRSRNVTLRRVVADDNGSGGLTAFAADDLLVEDSSTSRNGWRTSLGITTVRGDDPIDLNLVDWASGQKFFRLRGATFRRHEAIDNLAGGFWFDFDNVDVVIEDSTFAGNLTQGLFLEASQGPFLLNRLRICDNETGVILANSRGVTLRGSTLGGNVLAQLLASGVGSRQIGTRDGEDLDLASGNWTFEGNTLVADDDQRGLATMLGDDDWSTVLSTLSSQDNRFLSSGGGPMLETASREPVDLATWRAKTGQDGASTSGAAGPDTCPPPGAGQ